MMAENPDAAHTAARRMAWLYMSGAMLCCVVLGVLHVLYKDYRADNIRWFNLDKERNLPTWFNGALFFLIGCAAFSAWAWERRIGSAGQVRFRLSFLWLGVALAGWFMSLDEITILHENLFWKETRLSTAKLGETWAYVIQWQVLYFVPILIGLGFFVVFFYNRFRACRTSLVLAALGMACWLCAYLLEGVHFESLIIIEEECEMIGAVLLVEAVVFYIIDIALALDDRRRQRLLAADRILTRRAVAALSVATLLLIASALIIFYFAGKQAEAGAKKPALFRRAVREAAEDER